MCPPVPPAAISTRISMMKTCGAHVRDVHVQFLSFSEFGCRRLKQPTTSSAKRSARVLRDVEQNSDGRECRHQGRSTIRDERQRYPFCRHQRKHHTNIKERLRDDTGNDSKTQQHSKPVRREQGGADSTPEEKCKHCNHRQRSNQSELLTNYRKYKVGVRERKKQHLLFALGEPKTVCSPRSNCNQRLHNLKTRALLIGPWVKERDQTFQSKR